MNAFPQEILAQVVVPVTKRTSHASRLPVAMGYANRARIVFHVPKTAKSVQVEGHVAPVSKAGVTAFAILTKKALHVLIVHRVRVVVTAFAKGKKTALFVL